MTKNFDGINLSHLDEVMMTEINALSDDGVEMSNANTMLEAMKCKEKQLEIIYLKQQNFERMIWV
ncbi:hypothetical protein [Clostridium butyricum]|uniref:hypothetical protein n=1 Tax=Clostridium butyricum TaxID=1492 RepID=UPI00126A73C1|nr:hypothetical protein [Clostridium butyricum]